MHRYRAANVQQCRNVLYSVSNFITTTKHHVLKATFSLQKSDQTVPMIILLLCPPALFQSYSPSPSGSLWDFKRCTGILFTKAIPFVWRLGYKKLCTGKLLSFCSCFAWQQMFLQVSMCKDILFWEERWCSCQWKLQSLQWPAPSPACCTEPTWLHSSHQGCSTTYPSSSQDHDLPALLQEFHSIINGVNIFPLLPLWWLWKDVYHNLPQSHVIQFRGGDGFWQQVLQNRPWVCTQHEMLLNKSVGT